MIIRYPPSVAAPAPLCLFNLCQEIASILLFLATCYNQALFAHSLYPIQGLSSFYSSPPVTTRLFFPTAYISYPRAYPSFPRHLSQLGSFSHSLYPVQEPIFLFLTTLFLPTRFKSFPDRPDRDISHLCVCSGDDDPGVLLPLP